jgi:hypothetical protein
VAVVARAMLENDYDVETVFELASAELKQQGNSSGQIVSLLIGDIDVAKGPTSKQKEYAVLLAHVLKTQGSSLQEIAEAFLSHSFTLENVAGILKKSGVSIGTDVVNPGICFCLLAYKKSFCPVVAHRLFFCRASKPDLFWTLCLCQGIIII